ncbi:dihydroxyacetone kinase subunit DhaK [Devosia rhodophyticola]|uniref:Dihydroxyacetone kinase subunit DhaK n=1 Tax=Devosia rhodophyticola TaxID=3026423 RepID=A0ABY7Z172_9HYPH|nr:dihydroxyacetone kinase subunit DhaK [Devosia rhodophyticola]WDR07232.1 dihydroxyacetone kinase subunit DhaK [Devosia rhodophyticola]
MKKLINDPANYVEEMLDGLCLAHPGLKRVGVDRRAITTANPIRAGKVGIVSGGGSGHLPLFTGYVGKGLLDACAIGNVFEGPTINSCQDAIEAANGGAGVLCLFGNYGGDRMNFEMASEFAAMNDVDTRTVLGTDDIASASPAEADKRRGVAGLIFAYKAAGALAEGGGSLDAVEAIARKTVERTRTVGVALSSCQIPGATAPNFTIADNEIEMGMGIHGEPGIWRRPIRPADELVDEMIAMLLAERPEGATRVAILVNSLGATPLEELFILYRRAHQQLERSDLRVVRPLIGPYVTSMEMGGASISLCFLDEEIEELLAAPADCPFWRID